MSTISLNKNKGLRTFPNYLANNSGDRLTTASNVVIDKEDAVEPRRGNKVLTNLPDFAKQLLTYKDRVLAHYGNNLTYLDLNDPANLTKFKGTANFTIASSTTNITIVNHQLSVGNTIFFNKKVNYTTSPSSYYSLPPEINDVTAYVVYAVINSNTIQVATSLASSPITISAGVGTLVYDFIINEVSSGLRVKYVEMNSNLYITSADGVKKISHLNSFATSKAGGISALNIDATLSFSGAGGFFGPFDSTTQVEVSYRVVWGTKDYNTNLILGKPSERAIVQNYTGNNAQVDLSFAVPEGVDINYFYQVYRTNIFGIDASGDEMRLVIEAPYNGYSSIIQVTDNTPETIRDTGTPLYTNEYSGEGIFQSNDRPPVCQDMTAYKNRMWFANTKTTQKLDMTFLGFDGIDNGTTSSNITLSGTSTVTLTFSSAHSITNGQYIALANTTSNDGQYVATVTSPTQITLPIANSGFGSDYVLYRSYLTITKSSQVNRYFFVGRPEITRIVNLDLNSINATSVDYFNLTSINDKIKYYFWFFKTITDADPLVSGRVGIKIDLSTLTAGATAEEVRAVIKSTLQSTGDFTCVDVSTDTLDVQTVTSGAVTDVVSATKVGAAISSIAKTQDGFGEDYTKGFVRLSSYASPAQAIEDTAKSLVRVISFTTSSPVYAYYLNTSVSLPGQFYLEEKQFSNSPFRVDANSVALGQVFNPTITTSGVFASNNIGNNTLYFSKEQQPESVPTVNSFRIGPQDKAIKRILGLRDSLFILKEEGVYRLTGENESNFVVALFDNSATIIAPDSAVILNNQIYCLTTQGVATISETGVGIISRPIENIFNKASSDAFTSTPTATFGVSYEADRAYLLFIPSIATDSVAQVAYRYNTFTQTWTSFDVAARCGVVNIKNKMHLGADDITSILIERKSITSRDYVDRQYTRQTSAYSFGKMYIDNVSNIQVGDALSQTQYLTINQYNDLIGKLKLDPTLNFPSSFSSLTLKGGADFSSALVDLVAQLNTTDTSRLLKTFDGQADVAANTITIANHGFNNRDIVSVVGNLPEGISNVYYRVVNASTNTLQLTNLVPNILTEASAYGIGQFVSGSSTLLFNMVLDIDYSNSSIVIVEHGLSEGDTVTFTTSQTAPTGLISGRSYEVVNVDSNSFQVKELVVDITPSLVAGICMLNEVYYYSGSIVAKDLQNEFNDIVASLNDSDACFFTNYSLSSGSEQLDMIVKSVKVSQNYVILESVGPFYLGDIEHYQSIKSEIIYEHNSLGAAAMLKHVRTGSLMLENNSMQKITIGYASDLSGNFENNEYALDGNGDFGRANFGSTAFGGDGTAWPLRTILPRQKQRCRYVKARIYHAAAFIKYAILGISYDFETTSEKGYRGY
jgi:hypothetical protein